MEAEFSIKAQYWCCVSVKAIFRRHIVSIAIYNEHMGAVYLSVSKAWNWNEEKNQIWLNPSEESYFISDRWVKHGYKKLLDFGCGLGRHSIFFSKNGYEVTAFDLSTEGTNYLKAWAERENLAIDVHVADMLSLPYSDNTFDCIFAYHVISHTDTGGMRKIMNEIKRVIKPQGEIFITLCSKETWSFSEAGYPKIDENTIRKTEEGSEKDIPHFHVSLDDIIYMFDNINMKLLNIRHIDDCYFDGQKMNSKHYFILARKPAV